MAETTEVKLGRLDERMKVMESKVDTLIDEVRSLHDALSTRYATKEDLARVETRATKFLWVTNIASAIVSPLIVFLVVEYLKTH